MYNNCLGEKLPSHKNTRQHRIRWQVENCFHAADVHRGLSTQSKNTKSEESYKSNGITFFERSLPTITHELLKLNSAACAKLD